MYWPLYMQVIFWCEAVAIVVLPFVVRRLSW